VSHLEKENALMRALLGLSPRRDEDVVMDAVSLVTEVPEDDIMSDLRDTDTALARALFCHVMSRDYRVPSRRTAKRINRDGSTVRYNAILIDNMLSVSSSREVDLLKKIREVIKNVQTRQEELNF
jgi:hypothetical protein